MLHIALYQPAIPQNTGNIARTTVGMNAHLHVIHPMKFQISDQAAQRAGLDYWPHVKLTEHASEEAFIDWLDGKEPWLVTKFGKQGYHQVDYQDGDVLVLGNENSGLPEHWHQRWPHRCIHIPVLGPIRSFNLANASAIILAHATLSAGLADKHEFAPEKD